jgi:hypothetical protein
MTRSAPHLDWDEPRHVGGPNDITRGKGGNFSGKGRSSLRAHSGKFALTPCHRLDGAMGLFIPK